MLWSGDQRKDEFLAILAQELRGPLSAVVMASEMLDKGTSNPAQVATFSQIIAHQAGSTAGTADWAWDWRSSKRWPKPCGNGHRVERRPGLRQQVRDIPAQGGCAFGGIAGQSSSPAAHRLSRSHSVAASPADSRDSIIFSTASVA